MSVRAALSAVFAAAILASSFAHSGPDDASRVEETTARRELVTAAYQWLEATLARDFAAQSAFYPERMTAFYLWRDTPKAAVLAEKRRVFEQSDTLDIRMEPPQILIDAGARSGRMYFRKRYVIKGAVDRSGEVLQELRWAKHEDGWKITSERDLRVIRDQDQTG